MGKGRRWEGRPSPEFGAHRGLVDKGFLKFAKKAYGKAGSFWSLCLEDILDGSCGKWEILIESLIAEPLT